MQIGKSEILIQSTKERKVGERVAFTVTPENIHIMHKEFTNNRYIGYVTKKNTVVFADGEFECDVTQLYPGSTLDEEGYLITKEGESIDLTDVDVIVEVNLKDIEVHDDADEGQVIGTVVSSIYKGDHYQLIVRTDEEEEDFVLDTEYSYGENDRVAIRIAPDKIKLKLKAVEK